MVMKKQTQNSINNQSATSSRSDDLFLELESVTTTVARKLQVISGTQHNNGLGSGVLVFLLASPLSHETPRPPPQSVSGLVKARNSLFAYCYCRYRCYLLFLLGQ
jgi:hypothetical protein